VLRKVFYLELTIVMHKAAAKGRRWTEKESRQLLEGVRIFGRKWQQIIDYYGWDQKPAALQSRYQRMLQALPPRHNNKADELAYKKRQHTTQDPDEINDQDSDDMDNEAEEWLHPKKKRKGDKQRKSKRLEKRQEEIERDDEETLVSKKDKRRARTTPSREKETISSAKNTVEQEIESNEDTEQDAREKKQEEDESSDKETNSNQATTETSRWNDKQISEFQHNFEEGYDCDDADYLEWLAERNLPHPTFDVFTLSCSSPGYTTTTTTARIPSPPSSQTQQQLALPPQPHKHNETVLTQAPSQQKSPPPAPAAAPIQRTQSRKRSLPLDVEELLLAQRDTDDAAIIRSTPPPNATPAQLTTHCRKLDTADQVQISKMKERMLKLKHDKEADRKATAEQLSQFMQMHKESLEIYREQSQQFQLVITAILQAFAEQ